MITGIWGLIPRVKRMVVNTSLVDRTVVWGVTTGIIDGLALGALIPTITALASGQAAWGLSTSGWLIVLVVLAVLAAVANYLANRQGYDMALDFIINVHRKIGDQVAKMPLGWFHGPLAGRLSRMVSNELMTAGEILAHTLSKLVSGLTASLVLLIISWAWDWRLGLVLTVSAPILLLLLNIASGLMQYGKKASEPTDVELSSRIVEFTHCQAALRSCGQSSSFAELEVAQTERRRTHFRLLWLEMAGNSIGGAFTQIVVVALISLAAQLAITGSLDLWVSLAFIGISLRFTVMLTGILSSVLGMENNRALLDAVDEVLTAQPLPSPAQDAPITNSSRRGEIRFENVNFGYVKEEKVLNNISFTVPPRSMCALVGPSGCGKTTVARLVSRFYDVDDGTVSVDGIDVRDLTTESLMSKLSMVFQDVYLFDDTLEANIRIGREDATTAEVTEAARRAGVTEIIERLPDGWNTQVGEGGQALSGGERQRVAIARALLKNAPIVLLDEATSSLDTENEDNIVASMHELRESATLLVIAHKLTTIREADQIVLFTEDGQIEDIGTHDELIARGGTYLEFWQYRERAQGWTITSPKKML